MCAVFLASARDPTACAAHSPGLLSKSRVCASFFHQGKCPYGDLCEHAHTFFELNHGAQARLLRSVGTEGVPSHFMPAARPRRLPLSRSDRQTGASSPLSSSSRSSCTLSGTRAVLCDASFRPRLPARCCFPHRDFEGTYYDVLAVSPTASLEVIRDRFTQWQQVGYKRIRQADPVGANAIDCIIMEARNVLENPTLRAEYDQQLPSPCAATAAGSHSQTHGQSSSAISSTSSDDFDILESMSFKDDDLW